MAGLRQVESDMAVADVVRQLGISEQMFYRCKKVYGGLQLDQARKLKQLQEENAHLKRLVVELSLDKAILHDVAAKNVWSALCEQIFFGPSGSKQCASMYPASRESAASGDQAMM